MERFWLREKCSCSVNVHHTIRAIEQPLVLAIGFFDGMHRGHREIARRALRLRKLGWRAAVLTFSDHPAAFLRPGKQPPLITTSEERIDLLARAGYDDCFFVPFDASIALQEPEHFISATLVGELRVRAVVVGKTFRFGRKRRGDVAMLANLAAEHGVQAVSVDNAVDARGDRISSTRIRDLIAAGNLEQADDLLGHPYELRGRVVVGAGRGRGLGFPTANLTIPEKLLPKDGVYAAVARHDGIDYAALVSIGNNATFGGTQRTIEAWLRDFEASIYGEELTLRDFRFVRGQRAFAGADELVAQMHADAEAVAYPSYG